MTDDERQYFDELMKQTNAKLDAILAMLERGERQIRIDAAIEQLMKRINEPAKK